MNMHSDLKGFDRLCVTVAINQWKHIVTILNSHDTDTGMIQVMNQFLKELAK